MSVLSGLHDLDNHKAFLSFTKSLTMSGKDSKEWSEIERYILISYLLTILISSMVGDTIILIASTRYNALKLNKFILAILHHISICDLVTDISNVLPILAAIWTKGWVLGEFFTRISAFLAGWSYLLSNVLVVILTCSKFLFVKSPQKTRKLTAKKAHIICGTGWLAILLLLLPSIIPGLHVKVNLSYHDGRDFLNNFDYETRWTTLLIESLSSLIMIGAPILVLIFSVLTLKLLFEARQVSRRSRGSLRWQGIVTVVVTGVVFCGSMLPFSILLVMKYLNKVVFHVPKYIGMCLQSLTFVNAASNFFIYCLTVKSFRTFLSTKITLIRYKFRFSKRVASERCDSRNGTVSELQPI